MAEEYANTDQHRADMSELRGEVNEEIAVLRQELKEDLENWMRATFVTVVLVAVGVAAQLFYTLLRFGLKPSVS